MSGRGSNRENSLIGWYVISLRPSGEHAPLRRAAARLGARVIALSPLTLQPLAAGDALDRALHADRVVFSSPAAVSFAGVQRLLTPCATRIVLAVGAGTAAALANRGINAVHPPQQMTSEGLLALPEMQHLESHSVGLITAPGGRGLLAATLAQRAREVHVAVVYQRVARTIRRDAWANLEKITASLAIIVSSSEALNAMLQQCPTSARATLDAAMVVAASERLGEEARLAGFKHIVRAASARPSSMLQALAEFHGESRFR